MIYQLLRMLAVTTALPFLFACGDPAPGVAARGGWSGTIDTFPSGRIFVRNPDQAIWTGEDEWVLRERFRIGSLEGDGADVFGQIYDVEFGPGGDLYVLDVQADEVRVFGPDGTHVRTFGRTGKGPGELNRPAGMTFGPNGNLWVMNRGNARYTAFDPSSGALIQEPRRLASFFVIPWPGLFDHQGRLIDVGLSRVGDRGGDPALLRLDSAFVPTDTLLMPRPDERNQIAFRRGELMVMSTPDPFTPQPTWSPRPAGGIVVGEGAVYRLHRIGFDLDTTLTIEVLREPVPVTPAERDSALAKFRELAQEVGAKPERDPRIPRTKPAHGTLFVDDEDRIWVRRTAEAGEGPAWDVIDADGRFLGRVSTPVPPTFVQPAVRNDRLALVTEPNGVPTVVVYDLVRP